MKFIYLILFILLPFSSWSQIRDDAGLQGNAGAVSGFFDTPNPVNYPYGAAGWWHLLDVRHTNPANNYAMQFAGSFYDQNLYFRKTNNSATSPWLRVITEENGIVRLPKLTVINSGSHLNAGNIGSTTSDFVIQSNTGGRFTDKGAQLEFVIPADQNGENLWGQGRILTVAGNGDNHNAAGKMILGTRRMFNKLGTGPEWFYGDDIVIDGVGNVGMGTLTPNEKLSVKGRIRAQEVKVETSNWPDYVFDDTYQTGTLKDLESYIRLHKHLPDMPSAKELETNGVDLGGMLKLQQQKIEELTLHLIEKDKQIIKLKQADEMKALALLQIIERLKKLEGH